MAEVVMYSSPWCPYCSRAKKLLNEKGVQFEEIDVMMQPRKRVEMTERPKGGPRFRKSSSTASRSAAATTSTRSTVPASSTRCWDAPDGRLLTVACVQVNAGPEIEPNLHTVGDLILRAREAGADFITTPENVGMVVQGRARVLERARPEQDHPAIPFFQDLARRTGAWLLAGSLAVRLDGEDRAANRSLLFSPDGSIAARYDKIHMFDVDLANGESYRESATFRPGDKAVLAQTPGAASA